MQIHSRLPALIVASAAFLEMLSCKSGHFVASAPEVRSMTVAPTSLNLLVGATGQLIGTIDADAGVQTMAKAWVSSNPLVATVGSTGIVLALSPGSTTVTVSSVADPARYANAFVVVTAPGVTSVGVTPSTVSVTAGATQQFTATVTADPGIDQSVTWSSGSPSVASVNAATGLATAVAPGTASIIATSNFDHSKSSSGSLIVTTPSFSFTSLNGTYGGIASLTTNSATPGALGLLPQCQGSSSEYNEGILIALNAAGTGNISMVDAPSFPRTYVITLNSALMGTSSGSFPFLGATVPGWMSMSVNGTTVTFRETTQYGGCANSYAGSLVKY